jgi:hypothetical protein
MINALFLPHIPMSQPHLRRRYELMSFLLNAAVPISLVGVCGALHLKQVNQTQEIESLRAEVATIRLNLAVPTNVSPTHSSINSTNTANTSK